MKKLISAGILSVLLALSFSACGSHTDDYIKQYSKELQAALGDYTFEKKEVQYYLFDMDGTRAFPTTYLEWLITYTAPNGSPHTFTLNNRYDNQSSFYDQITEACISRIESEIKDIAHSQGFTGAREDSIIASIKPDLDMAETNEKFMLYPAYTDLKTLAAQYDCTITLQIDYGSDTQPCRKTIQQLIAHCDNKVTLLVYCDLLGRGDIDPFQSEERFVNVYSYQNGACILDDFTPVLKTQ